MCLKGRPIETLENYDTKSEICKKKYLNVVLVFLRTKDGTFCISEHCWYLDSGWTKWKKVEILS